MLPWQTAFLTIGPMGVVLAIILLFMREPVRSDIIAREAGGPSTTLAAAVAYVAPRWRAFGTLFVGSGCVVTMGSLTLWNVALFQRIWQWNVAEVGIATGVLYFCGGGFGTILGVVLTQRWQKAGKSAVTLRVLWTGLAIGVPGFALFPLMPDVRLALAGLFLAFTGQAMATAAGPASLSLLAPGQIRAQATAIYYLIIGVAGQVLGPPPVGWMADLFGDPKGLRYAVSIEAIAVGLPALLLVYLGTKAFARAEQALEAQVAS
jgi:MFS family permease